MAHSTTLALTRNNQLVLDALVASRKPLSAYELLDRLSDQGLRAPPQIYRALKALASRGLVHKLQSANAFVACAHTKRCGGEACADGQAVFLLCEGCGEVEEVTEAAVAADLRALVSKRGFVADATAIEIRGHCADCAAA
ncbi:MAG: transcriptional repressor [Devosiaceae bacterium]|nr:transcriptional repressor [Devosiaceae bacterium MH13]